MRLKSDPLSCRKKGREGQMINIIKNLWDSALVRGLVVLTALGSAPVILLSMATKSLGA